MQISSASSTEHWFHSVIRNSTDIIAIIDAQGNYTYVSPSCLLELGYDASFFNGRNAFEFIHPEDIEPLLAILADIPNISELELPHYRILAANNEYRWIQSRLTNLLHDPVINGIIVNSKDITEKKIAEEEIHRLSLVAKETVNGVTITNKEGKVVWVNKAFTRITGYTLEEMQGHYPGEILRGAESSERVTKFINDQVNGRLPFDCEILNYRKNGEQMWMRVQGQPIFDSKGKLYQYFALQTDITKEKEIRELARFHEQKLNALILNTFDVMEIVDIAGNFTFVSPAIERVMGFKPEELINKDSLTFIHPDDLEVAYMMFGKVLDEPGQTNHIILRIRNKSGDYRICDVHARNLVSDKYIKGIVVNFRDITERVELEEMLMKEKVNAQKAITMASIRMQENEREVIGKELHDNVNQILTSAKLFLDMTKNQPQLILDHVKQSRELIMMAIQEIRKLSKALVPPSLNDVSLEQSLNGLLETIETLKEIRCYTRFAFDETKLQDVVKFTIYRVVQEQITNICKYSQATELLLSLVDKDDKLVLIISDNGVGFDPRAKRNGIGLKNIAERIKSIDGKFQLITEPGAGCKLVITI